ncbi:hypothetical protein AGDE_07673 [Angomonas deanei]|nr:hypothetical protein AGDE_07673 [Angomonas deanei]|eukprot:EPY34963.1 hypothetical protein AGDE_07673 [Angomonas deanei]
MTFAHPDRWANVEIVNVTFTGPVTVRRAHITFRNCVFVSRSTAVPQLNVTQYCKVSCVKCTFEAPLHSSLYTFPQAQVSVLKCLFTGVPQRLVMKELPAIQEKNDEEEHGGKAAADVLLTPALQEAFQLMQSQQPATVAVYYDGSASLSVDKCRVLCYGTGVLLRGHCSSDRSASPTVSVTKSAFHHLCNTALLVEGNARDVLVKENQVSDCAYYGLDCRSGAKEIKVTKNNFSVGAAVRLRENSSAQLLHNNFHSIPIDDNKAHRG